MVLHASEVVFSCVGTTHFPLSIRGNFGASVWDKMVFAKVQALMGGRIRQMVTGAAPVNPDVLNFARCVLGTRVSSAVVMR